MFNFEILATAAGPARLRRSNRRTLAITVTPDGSLELVAPHRADLRAILTKVSKRTAWIRRQQRAFVEMNGERMPLRYSSGATHRYLGSQYRLKVTKGNNPGVKLSRGYFWVTSDYGSEAEVEKLVTSWMREKASEQFNRRIEKWRTWCQRHRLPLPQVVLRAMPKRWGSSQKNGRIALNPLLVRAPSVCIDYVIAHEVCHIKHPNHGPDFYRQLEALVPDWQKIKRRLEQCEF